MSDNLKIIGCAALVLAIVGGAIAWEVSLWSECRQTNSWFYRAGAVQMTCPNCTCRKCKAAAVNAVLAKAEQ